jgi:hypothetical protein
MGHRGLTLSVCSRTQPTRIQLYGQRCSGTNYAAALLRANLGETVLTQDYGFKHWFVPRQVLVGPETLVLVIARDAFDWVRSLYREPWHADPALKALDFAGFIRAEWVSRWDDHCYGIDRDHPMYGAEMLHERCQQTGIRFANCIAKRTAKLRQWGAMYSRAHNVGLLTYEALRAEPKAIVGAIAEAMGLCPAGPFVRHDSYKGQEERVFTATAYPPLNEVDARHVADWLDPAVEATFGLPATYDPARNAGGQVADATYGSHVRT